jgi:Bacterial protein of unknown function (DUF937)
MNLINAIESQLSDEVMSKLSSLIGAKEDATRTAAGAAVPALLSGLSNLASRAGGAQQLISALGKLQGGSLANMASMLNSNPSAVLDQGGGLLNSLLGGNVLSGIVNTLARFAGLGSGSVQKLLGYLTPLALASIAGRFTGKTISPQGLTSMLAEQKDNIADAFPSGFSMDNIPGVAAAGAAARQAVGAAQDAGGSAVRWLLPIAGVALLGLLAWYALGRREAAAPVAADTVNRADNAVKTVTAQKVPIEDPAQALPSATQLGKDLTTIYTSATETLGSIKDAASAEKALPQLKDLTEKVDGLKSVWDKLPAAGQSTIRSITSSQLGKLKELVARVEAMPGVGDKIKPALDQLVSKLSEIGQS